MHIIWQLVFRQGTSVFGKLGWATSSALVKYWFTNEEILEPVPAKKKRYAP